MIPAFRAFMTGLVDYAGLFPPASLELEAAMKEYAGHLEDPEAWMLGRFIIPAARITGFWKALKNYQAPQDVWKISLLVGDRQDPDRTLADLDDHFLALNEAHQACGHRFSPESLEIPIPFRAVEERPSEFLAKLLPGLSTRGMARGELYLEIPPQADPEIVLPVVAALDPMEFTSVAAKLRCGGVTPEAFPSCERIAQVILECRRLELPLKCTAGLHHPVRHRASEPHVMMHGFFNVFGAGMLAFTGASDEVVLGCVEETDPTAFRFDEAGFHWREHVVAAADVAKLRKSSLAGFGSCSFAEPREDLQSLGWL